MGSPEKIISLLQARELTQEDLAAAKQRLYLEIAKAQAEKEAEKELNNPLIDVLDVAQEGPVLQPCSDTPKQGKGEKPPKKWGGG
jgi:hypothetical protein